jgi:imidazolonepropionase
MLLLRNIAQIVTLREGPIPRTGSSMSELGIIENGAVLIRGERIEWVGPAKDIPAPERGISYQTLDGVGLDLIALPGFIDAHTHPIFARMRYEEYDLRIQGKTPEEIAAISGKASSAGEQLHASSMSQLFEIGERSMRQFLAHGTTTIEAKSAGGVSFEDELKSLHVLSSLRERSRMEIAPTFLIGRAPEEFAGSRSDYIREVTENIIPQVAREGLALYCDVICENGYFNVQEARVILNAAEKAGLKLRVHAEEQSHSGGALLAAGLKAQSADHLQWIDEADVQALKAAGTVATLLPGMAFNLGSKRYAPARKLIEEGVPVALGTDFNPNACFTPNMQLMLAFACTQMRMTPAEALDAATVNSAYSLGIADRLGTIEKGKQADIVLMSVSDYRELPYFFGVNHCVVTIKKGNILINRMEQP